MSFTSTLNVNVRGSLPFWNSSLWYIIERSTPYLKEMCIALKGSVWKNQLNIELTSRVSRQGVGCPDVAKVIQQK